MGAQAGRVVNSGAKKQPSFLHGCGCIYYAICFAGHTCIDWAVFLSWLHQWAGLSQNFLSQPTAAFSMVVMFVLAVSSFCAGRFFAGTNTSKGLSIMKSPHKQIPPR